MLEADLIAYLTENVEVVGGRVYLGNAPQNVSPPALVVIRLLGETPRTLNGSRLFSRAAVQLAAIGDDRYAPVLAAANQARAAIDNFRGYMGSTFIESCRCQAEPQDASYIDGTKTMRQLLQEFRIVYRGT